MYISPFDIATIADGTTVHSGDTVRFRDGDAEFTGEIVRIRGIALIIKIADRIIAVKPNRCVAA